MAEKRITFRVEVPAASCLMTVAKSKWQSLQEEAAWRDVKVDRVVDKGMMDIFDDARRTTSLQ